MVCRSTFRRSKEFVCGKVETSRRVRHVLSIKIRRIVDQNRKEDALLLWDNFINILHSALQFLMDSFTSVDLCCIFKVGQCFPTFFGSPAPLLSIEDIWIHP